GQVAGGAASGRRGDVAGADRRGGGGDGAGRGAAAGEAASRWGGGGVGGWVSRAVPRACARGWPNANLSIQSPMISWSPSTTDATSSGVARPSRGPMRSTASVRIWLTFTQAGFGRRVDRKGTVSGKPARCGWLVMATAITVPERSLKTSWLR